ncbi:MAG: FAD:protein FMN transferase [Acidobacteria bacterium]|nr:MAG: FAD:protein FMN transferase [Acidobacteriota bacterium]PYQ25276.1 MAG: FAD:protein FMN transferase [Acidobacteriota bacterium]
MLRARRGATLLAGSLLAVSPAPSAGSAGALFRHEASRMSMGCAYAIVAYGPDGGALPGIVDSAFDEVDRIDRLMSHYRPESPLSRLNREASRGPVAVEPELFDFIAASLQYGRDSGGAFDITVGPLMKAWGFFRGGGRVPGEDELSELRRRVGYEHVVLDARARTIRFDRPGMELDLGGIAKGYAVDRAVSLLKSRRIAAALVSAGGSTLYGLGAPPGRKAWDVAVQDPGDPGRVAVRLRLRDRALSVSGSYEKSFERDGVRYSHIMDPRSARPVQGVLSVAVLCGSGTAGDALDDAFFVQGVEGSRAYLQRLPATEAYFFLPAAESHWRVVHLRSRAPVEAHFTADRSTTP